jgi:hypothetical protein
MRRLHVHVTGFSAATILVFAIASPLHAQGIEVFGGADSRDETARAVSLFKGGSAMESRAARTDRPSLLQPYRFLGYASLEDNDAVEIRDLDCIGRAERLAIRPTG